MKKIPRDIYSIPTDSVRNRLLPFDEISDIGIEIKRRKHTLANHIDNLKHQAEEHRKKQNERLIILSKVNDRSYQVVFDNMSLYKKICSQLDGKYKIIRPDTQFMFMWNFIIFLAIIFNFFEIPMALFMTNNVYWTEMHEPAFLSINIISITILFIDTFFLRFNIAYYQDSILIKARKQIIKRYLKTYFVFDALAWICFLTYLSAQNPELIYLKLLFYLKLPTLIYIDKQMLQILHPYRIRCCVFKFFRIIILLWFITTWVSSVYFAIDYSYYKEEGYYFKTGQLWLINSNAVDNINVIQSFSAWYVWYQYAVYWSMQTSSTCGYGDMTPRNPNQVFYCCFIIIFNTFFFAYYINSIWNIIGDLTEYSNKYKENWTNLKVMFKSQNIPKQLNQKIGAFLQQIWINQDTQVHEQQLGSSLSVQLQNQLYFQIRNKFFSNLPIFDMMNKFSLKWTQAVKELVYLIQKQKIGQGEDIFSFTEKDANLYYLVVGRVELNAQRLHIGKQIEKGEHFGFQQFINKKPRFCTALSLSFCVYWKLSRSQLIVGLKKYPILYQHYCQLEQRITLYNEVKLSNIKCLKCESNDHFLRNCTVLNNWRTKIAKPIYIKKQIRSKINQERVKMKRLLIRNDKIRGTNLIKTQNICDKVYLMKGYKIQHNIK